MARELSRKQEEVVARVALEHGGTRVHPLPEHPTVVVCGWDESGEDGARRLGPWLWVHEDGSHGPVDRDERVFEVLQEARAYVARRATDVGMGGDDAQVTLARVDAVLTGR